MTAAERGPSSSGRYFASITSDVRASAGRMFTSSSCVLLDPPTTKRLNTRKTAKTVNISRHFHKVEDSLSQGWVWRLGGGCGFVFTALTQLLSFLSRFFLSSSQSENAVISVCVDLATARQRVVGAVFSFCWSCQAIVRRRELAFFVFIRNWITWVAQIAAAPPPPRRLWMYAVKWTLLDSRVVLSPLTRLNNDVNERADLVAGPVNQPVNWEAQMAVFAGSVYPTSLLNHLVCYRMAYSALLRSFVLIPWRSRVWSCS